MNVSAGDRLLLCSDGLSGMVDDPLLESILARVKDPQRCAAALVNEAITAGGHDNVTAIVVDAPSNAEAIIKKETIKGRIGAIIAAIALVLVLAGGIGGSLAYLNHTAFLGEQDGNVTVYRGMPGAVMGISLSTFDHDTGLAVEELDNIPANVSERLKDGIRVDSVADADALVETWKKQIEEHKQSATPEGESEKDKNSSASATTNEKTTNPQKEASSASERTQENEGGDEQ